MRVRFYAPALAPADQTVALPDDEAQHLVRTLRIGRGTEVRVFNGRGFECTAIVELADKRGVVLRTASRIDPAPELPFTLTLAQAVLKGDKFDEIVRDATMLGVAGVQPLLTRNIDVPHAYLARGHRVDRWQRIAVSSAKQSGRAVVPHVRDSCLLAEALASDDDIRIVLVEPKLAADVRAPRDVPRPSRAATVFAGPEGGWTSEEISQASAAGATFVTLGARTLRADAVALVALPVLLFAWEVL